MGTYTRIAFHSIQRCKALPYDDIWVRRVLYPGLVYHFKHPDEPVVIWVETTKDSRHVSVHMELLNEHGEIEQPWVLSFSVNPQHDTVLLGECRHPFPDEAFKWDTDFKDPKEALECLRKWAQVYWPDWEPVFVLTKVSGGQEDLREMLKEIFHEYLQLHKLEPDTRLTSDHLVQRGLVIVSTDEDGTLVQTTEQLLAALKKELPGLISKRILPE